MRFAIVLLCLIAVAGCDPRSEHLPPTDKWVRFHCPKPFSDQHACMVEMPGKPQLTERSLYKQFGSNGPLDIYTFACGTDGEYGVCAVEIPEHERDPPLSADELLEHGQEIAQRNDATLTVNKAFLYQDKYPALDISGAKTRGLAGNFRVRIIYYQEYKIVLTAIGRTKVVREPEVTYFFDSLLLYK